MSRDRNLQHLLVRVGLAIGGMTVVTVFLGYGLLGTQPYVEIATLSLITIACFPLLGAGLIGVRQGVRQLKRATRHVRKEGRTRQTTLELLLGLGAVVFAVAVVVMLASGIAACIRGIVASFSQGPN